MRAVEVSEERDMTVEFRVLGPLEVSIDGRSLKLGGPKLRLLLALLLLHSDEVVPTTRLLAELWDEQPPKTAVASLQMHVSGLRRRLGAESSRLLTRGQGYVLCAGDALDLRQFERLLETAEATFDPVETARYLRAAEQLWRGSPLADLAPEPALRIAIARLDELRLTALERRIQAELALGQHAALVPELDALVAEHPFREQFQWQRILALYRCRRQADALAAYRAARQILADQLGLEPGRSLRELERAVLEQDASLELDSPIKTGPERERRAGSVMVVLQGNNDNALLAVACPLAAAIDAELLLVRPVAAADELSGIAAGVERLRSTLRHKGLPVRAAAFVSQDANADLGRLASDYDVELLIGADAALVAVPVSCDVAVLFGQDEPRAGGAVVALFGGNEHDWTAVELAARLALARQTTLQLAGTAADDRTGRRDASLALADASLAVQYALDISAEPILLGSESQSLVDVATTAGIVVAGVSEHWRREGIGSFRRLLARDAAAPIVYVRHGPRPGALAPRAAATRYTWSLRPAGAQAS